MLCSNIFAEFAEWAGGQPDRFDITFQRIVNHDKRVRCPEGLPDDDEEYVRVQRQRLLLP